MAGSAVLDRERSLLVVIDIQGRLVEQVYRKDLLLASVDRLMAIADNFSVPVLLSEQYPQGLGPTEPGVLERFESLATEKALLVKDSFACTGDESFEATVAQLVPDIDVADRQYVISGIEAHVCVVQTVVALLEQGSSVFVCWECVTGRGEEYRRHALERMQQAGAVLTNHESVGFEWAKSRLDPAFKPLNQLLRQGQIS